MLSRSPAIVGFARARPLLHFDGLTQRQILRLELVEALRGGAVGDALLVHPQAVAEIEALLAVPLGVALAARDDEILLQPRDGGLGLFVAGEARDQRRRAGAMPLALLR